MLWSYADRLYPGLTQVRSLRHLRKLPRERYNAALEERREAWRKSRVSVNYCTQANQLPIIRTARPNFAGLNYSACQQTLRCLN